MLGANRISYRRTFKRGADVKAPEFFQGFVNHALVTLHIDNLKGENAHHQCETVFKAFARALRVACAKDRRLAKMLPSTKGLL